jgi:iron-sulfur cluster assembly protein
LRYGGRRKNVINVTEDARELFLSVERPEGTVLRLDPVEQDENGQTQIGLVAGEPQGDDQVVQHDGQDLLHIAAPVSEALDGASIDKVETPEGVGFSINPPERGPQS